VVAVAAAVGAAAVGAAVVGDRPGRRGVAGCTLWAFQNRRAQPKVPTEANPT